GSSRCNISCPSPPGSCKPDARISFSLQPWFTSRWATVNCSVIDRGLLASTKTRGHESTDRSYLPGVPSHQDSTVHPDHRAFRRSRCVATAASPPSASAQVPPPSFLSRVAPHSSYAL